MLKADDVFVGSVTWGDFWMVVVFVAVLLGLIWRDYRIDRARHRDVDALATRDRTRGRRR